MYVTPQPDLRAFLKERVNLPPERLDSVNRTINHLKAQLQRHISENEDFALVEILNSGSVEKKTAITPLNDVDVAIVLRWDELPDDDRESLLERVMELLIELYASKPREDFSPGRHAVRIRFREKNLSVDVVPLIPNPEDSDFGLLSTRDSDEWVLTSIPRHLKFIRDRIREHPNYLDLVRLTKWWRKERGVHFKSFLIELLWAHLLDEKVVEGNDLGEALLGFFGYIVRTGLRDPIHFRGQEIPESVTGPVRVLDPVNATNNVAARIDEGRREELVAACREAFEALAAAQTAPTAAVARDYYQRVFGPGFRLPADVPGEPPNPTALDHVVSKIHADLRQLRILYGTFDRETELSRANGISLWIERGFAADIELAYDDQETRERRVSLRYDISRDAASSQDNAPSAIPVRAIPASISIVHITGTEAWRSLGPEEKDAFFKELGDGWGPGGSRAEEEANWKPSHSYARGDLVARRFVYWPPNP